MALQVSGKTALVTGAGSGICLAFTKLLLANSCKVLIVDLALTPEAEQVVEENKGKVLFKKTDVTNWTQLREAFETAISEFGSLDIVCPGAGVFEPPWSNFWHFKDGVDSEKTNSYKTLDINLTHPIRATQLALDVFQRQHTRGTILLISSIAAQGAFVTIPLYCVSKAGISSFTRSLALLEPQLGIRVVAVAPAIVKTPIWTEDKLEMVDEDKDEWVSRERVAEVMLEMVQEEKYVGGSVVEVGVDGLRFVQGVGDSGPPAGAKGFTVSRFLDTLKGLWGLVESQFGK